MHSCSMASSVQCARDPSNDRVSWNLRPGRPNGPGRQIAPRASANAPFVDVTFLSHLAFK